MKSSLTFRIKHRHTILTRTFSWSEVDISHIKCEYEKARFLNHKHWFNSFCYVRYYLTSGGTWVWNESCPRNLSLLTYFFILTCTLALWHSWNLLNSETSSFLLSVLQLSFFCLFMHRMWASSMGCEPLAWCQRRSYAYPLSLTDISMGIVFNKCI